MITSSTMIQASMVLPVPQSPQKKPEEPCSNLSGNFARNFFKNPTASFISGSLKSMPSMVIPLNLLGRLESS
uniref:Uncharacterized protein n=1 Tax=uncultured marine virus TaxID=186617 RepID=A0A0F7L3K0_9VIRU|nr:hypothetical protein [uncultured marine virus]